MHKPIAIEDGTDNKSNKNSNPIDKLIVNDKPIDERIVNDNSCEKDKLADESEDDSKSTGNIKDENNQKQDEEDKKKQDIADANAKREKILLDQLIKENEYKKDIMDEVIQNVYKSISEIFTKDILTIIVDKCISVDDSMFMLLKSYPNITRWEKISLINDIYAGRECNVPGNITLNSSFIMELLRYKEKSTLNEYNNLCKFIKLVEKNHDDAHYFELKRKSNPHILFADDNSLTYVNIALSALTFLHDNYDEVLELSKNIIEDKKLREAGAEAGQVKS